MEELEKSTRSLLAAFLDIKLNMGFLFHTMLTSAGKEGMGSNATDKISLGETYPGTNAQRSLSFAVVVVPSGQGQQTPALSATAVCEASHHGEAGVAFQCEKIKVCD